MEQKLFDYIDSTIRAERLYANVNLMRADVMHRFCVGRHRLNALLNDYAAGKSFPRYINDIRMEVARELLSTRFDLSVSEVARHAGLTSANLRKLFGRQFGMSPTRYRQHVARGTMPPLP